MFFFLHVGIREAMWGYFWWGHDDFVKFDVAVVVPCYKGGTIWKDTGWVHIVIGNANLKLNFLLIVVINVEVCPIRQYQDWSICHDSDSLCFYLITSPGSWTCIINTKLALSIVIDGICSYQESLSLNVVPLDITNYWCHRNGVFFLYLSSVSR